MTKPIDDIVKDLELLEADDLDDLADDDYVFIVRADGSLKSVIFPAEEQFKYSDDLLAVFASVGIDNPETLMDRTVH
jgi:hypothetical protein